MRTLALLLATIISCGLAMPQEESVSADDILRQSGGEYGDDAGAVDSELLNSIFGVGGGDSGAGNSEGSGSESVGTPKGTIVDTKYDNCSYYAQDGYRCVPFYRCRDGYIITDGGGLFDIRLLDDVQLDPENSKCESYLEICCRDEDFFGQGLTVDKPVVTEAPSLPQKSTETPKAVWQPKCGRRNVGGIGVRIQNDDQQGSTQYGEWPHMCAVLNQGEVAGESVNLYVCGGSLIAPNIILTGAHCVNDLDASTVKVRCGEWDTQQTIEPLEHQDRYAKHISIHPAFNSRNIQNNFALIHLDAPFDLNRHIDTICLPDQFEGPYSYLTEGCAATGWGKDEFGVEGQYQVILKQVFMDLVGHHQCEDRLKRTRLGPSFKLDQSFVCAGGIPGVDTCKGDGGGPLVCPTKPPSVPSHEQQYVQSGIVSWGIECGKDIPGVYANVSDALCFYDWATKCVEGQEANYFGYHGCKRWGKRQYCEYKSEISSLDYQIANTNEIREKGRMFRQKRKLEALLPKFEVAIAGCTTGPGDFDCDIQDYYFDESDDVDLTGLVRDDIDSVDDKAAADNDGYDIERINLDAAEEDDDPRSGVVDRK